MALCHKYNAEKEGAELFNAGSNNDIIKSLIFWFFQIVSVSFLIVIYLSLVYIFF